MNDNDGVYDDNNEGDEDGEDDCDLCMNKTQMLLFLHLSILRI